MSSASPRVYHFLVLQKARHIRYGEFTTRHNTTLSARLFRMCLAAYRCAATLHMMTSPAGVRLEARPAVRSQGDFACVRHLDRTGLDWKPVYYATFGQCGIDTPGAE